MKKALFFILLLASGVAAAQTWTVDKAHSKLGFSVTHLMVSEVEGSFKSFDAKITTSKDDFSDAVIEMTADVNTIDTDNESRDNHLKAQTILMQRISPRLPSGARPSGRLEIRSTSLLATSPCTV